MASSCNKAPMGWSCTRDAGHSGPCAAVRDLAKDDMVHPVNENVMERIVWVDSGLSFASTWLDEETVVGRAKEWDGKVTTVGQVVYEDETRLVVGLSKDAESGNWAGAFLIYKPAILERTTLG